ncbi:MAG: hypothetical protein R3C30_08660 [Hyphomonadaceae bacterium]
MNAFANALLRAPPLLITLLWFAPWLEVPFQEMPRYLRNGVSVGPLTPLSIISFVSFLAWNYALYSASRSRTAPALRDRHGSKAFATAIAAFAVYIPLGVLLYGFEGRPPDALVAIAGALIAATVLCYFATIAYAAEAMHKAQKALGQEPEWHPLLALLFIGIGIWFIYRSIQHLLAQPEDPAP